MVTARAGKGSLRRRLRQAGRAAGWVALVALGAGALLVLSLLLPAVRGALLGYGLQRADEALPGRLAVGRASWPHFGVIELEDVVWCGGTDSPGAVADTLVHVRRLAVGVDLRGLRQHDLGLDSLTLDLAAVDVPAIVAQWPPATGGADSLAAPAAGWSGPFLREGALPQLPSLSLAGLRIRVDRALLAPDLGLRGVHLAGSAELRGGRRPALVVTRAEAALRRGGAQPLSARIAAMAASVTGGADGWIGVDSLSIDVASAGPAGVVARWPADQPLRLTVRGRVRPQDGGGEGDLVLAVAAPLAPLWGDAWPLPVGDGAFASVAADLHLRGRAGADSVDVRLTADLAGTPGLQRARLEAAAAFAVAAPLAGSVVVDSLDLAVPGFALGGGGTANRDRVDARLRARLATPCPTAEAFVPGLADIEIDARADLRLAGPGRDPRVELAVSGAVQSAAVAVPRARLEVRGDRRDLALRLAAGGGVARGGASVADSLLVAVRLRPALDENLRLPPRITAEVAADVVAARNVEHGRLRARLDFDPTAPLDGTVELDTLDVGYTGLAVRAGGRLDRGIVDLAAAATLATPCPVLELFVPALAGAELAAEAAVEVRGSAEDPRLELRLSGSGAAEAAVVPRFELAAAGDRHALQADLRAGGGLVVGGRALADSLVLAARLEPAAPDSLPLSFGAGAWQGDRSIGLAGAAAVDSLILVRLDTLAVVVAGQRVRLQEPATVRLDTASRQLDVSRLVLSGDPGTVDLQVHARKTAARVQGTIDLLLTEAMLQFVAPSPVWSGDGGLDLAVAGAVDLDVGPAAAEFSGGVDVRMLPHRGDPHLAAALSFGLVEGDSAGLGAEFALSAGDTVLVRGTVLWPGRFDRERGRWTSDPGRLLDISIPRHALPVQVMRRLVPAGLSVRGDLEVGARAGIALPGAVDAGAPPPGHLSGVVVSRRLQVELPNGSRLEAVMDCALAGTPAAPRIEGRVRVPSGFLRIPEIPRNLLATEGEARLWAGAVRDTQAGRAPGGTVWGPDEESHARTPFFPELDLQVEVPGNLRVHGYGLDVEVSAEVDVRRGVDVRGRPGPALEGTARSVQGTLRFMNRVFAIERAEVQFTGQVPPDPLLDMVLKTDVGGTAIRLAVSGWAAAPVIDLTSDPDMNKADIMAYLLFGRPLGELDTDQRGRMGEEPDAAQQLRQNLAGLALAFGTADLQSSVSSTLGVDIVEVGADAQGGSTLTAGKFISPKILLKYNASLEKAGTYFVTLEYALTQVFKVVSTYGQGEEASGLELKWIRRY